MKKVHHAASTAALCLGLALTSAVPAGEVQVSQTADVATAVVSDPGMPDIVNARPMPLPRSSHTPSLSLSAKAPTYAGTPGAVAGNTGTGQTEPVFVGVSKAADMEVAPQEFGAVGPYPTALPYTTSRVDPSGAKVAKYYPFRAAGKLFFTDPTSGYSYVCSASLIKPGVVVTAAHCVASFGESRFYSNWLFVPAYNNGAAPYGSWSVASATVKNSYLNGTDSCSPDGPGVVCVNDVAVLVLTPKVDAAGASYYAGKLTGWFGYGYNGWGFTGGATQITQLGYPVALDGGKLMERTDSAGFVDANQANNTIIGSLQTGGSSGGPWVANLGVKPALSGISFGLRASANTVVGVTSWGFTNSTYKIQGASPFTSNNIVSLMNTACTGAPAACGL